MNTLRFRSGVQTLAILVTLCIAPCRAAESAGEKAPVTAKTTQKAPPEAEAEVNGFIDSYFTTWSEQKMEAYGAHFHELSTVHMIVDDVVYAQNTVDFLNGQVEAHRRSVKPMTEAPLRRESLIGPDGRFAQVTVYWELRQEGMSPRRGYDLFNLKKIQGAWKIMDLTFFEESPPAPEPKPAGG